MAEQKVKLKKRKAKRRICTPATQPTTHLQFCRERKYRQADFRAEKRSAQSSAHPLSQAQGGLFCVLTVFDSLFVCP